jgi:hypothetical protein
MTTPRRVISGSGAIGPALLDALHRRGRTARMVNRSAPARVPDDVEAAASAEPGPSPGRSPSTPTSRC